MTVQEVGLRAKVLTSAKLFTLRFASSIGLRLISTVVLTRLLAPEIYGLFAVVLVFIYLLEMFSDLGLRSLVLTKEGELEDDFLRTCWTVSILRGCLIALISCLIAAGIGLLQNFDVFAADSPYAATELPWVLTALGATMIIGSLRSPMIFVQERNLIYGKVTAVGIIVNVAGLLATIAAALYFRSVWALVLGNVARTMIDVALSFWVFPGTKMRPCLNRTYLALVVDRGRWIIGHSVLTALSQSGDRLVLGLMMSSTTFGFYFIARQLVDIMRSFLMSIDGQMGIQVFTHLQKSDTARFRRNYYRYRLFFDALAGLSTGSLVILAPVVVEVLFDDRYLEVAPIVQILVWGILLVGPLLLRSAFSAERRFREMTLLSVVSTVTLWGGLGIAYLVFDSVFFALTVIALHRLPEAMICIIKGGDRDWVIIWREFMGFAFCAVGLVIGWGGLALWNALT